MAGVHAKISPSGAHRWIECPPSIQLSESFPNKESEFAAEGTLAHTIGELLIKMWLQIGLLPDHIEKISLAEKDLLYKPEMKRLMMEYRDYVVEQYAVALKESGGNAEIHIETRLDLGHIIPDGFGFGDVCIVWPGNLRFIDLKYGKGVKVDAKENPQQMLYACGALRKFAKKYNIENVHITIYQPRLDHIDTWHITTTDLMAWAHDVAVPAAKIATNGGGEFKAGHHCIFCPAKGACRTFAEFNMDIAREEFTDPQILTPEEISNIVLKSSIFTGWIEAVKDDAIRRVKAGEITLPGLKLVEGISRRKYKDEAAIAKTLIEEVMFSEEEIYKRQLIGFGEMETLIGKKHFNTYVGDFIIKPPGSPTLVPLTDKRPAIGNTEAAQSDFEGIDYMQ